MSKKHTFVYIFSKQSYLIAVCTLPLSRKYEGAWFRRFFFLEQPHPPSYAVWGKKRTAKLAAATVKNNKRPLLYFQGYFSAGYSNLAVTTFKISSGHRSRSPPVGEQTPRRDEKQKQNEKRNIQHHSVSKSKECLHIHITPEYILTCLLYTSDAADE